MKNKIIGIAFSEVEMESVKILLEKYKINNVQGLIRYLITKTFCEMEEQEIKAGLRKSLRGPTAASKKLERWDKEKELRSMSTEDFIAALRELGYIEQDDTITLNENGTFQSYTRNAAGEKYPSTSNTLDNIINDLKIMKLI